jgi:methionyl-tRNA formyltransferase
VRVGFIGCVEFSYAALSRVLAHKDADVVGIVTRAASPFNADFRSLEPLAREYSIPYLLAEGNDQTDLGAWLRQHDPEVLYCFGWSYLLKPEILAIPELGVVGYHPAALPKNRGRHPIIWALALGLDSTASTFFFMDEGADSGDILSQEPVPIRETDDARILYDRLVGVAAEQIDAFTTTLADGTYTRTPQEHSRANYWRKRGKRDGRIDWRMSSRSVHNHVRALTRPYPGAHFDLGSSEVIIWRAERVDDAFPQPNHEPGKVLTADDDSFVVKCGEGAVRVLEWIPSIKPEVDTYLA